MTDVAPWLYNTLTCYCHIVILVLHTAMMLTLTI